MWICTQHPLRTKKQATVWFEIISWNLDPSEKISLKNYWLSQVWNLKCFSPVNKFKLEKTSPAVFLFFMTRFKVKLLLKISLISTTARSCDFLFSLRMFFISSMALLPFFIKGYYWSKFQHHTICRSCDSFASPHLHSIHVYIIYIYVYIYIYIYYIYIYTYIHTCITYA